MHDDDPRLLRLTRAIADGAHVDWEDADRLAAEGDETTLFEALRTVAHIAWFHRVQQLASGTGPEAESADAGSPHATPRSAPAPATPRPPATGVRRTLEPSERWCHLEIRNKLG